jgi:hypothetical protein
MSKGRRADIHEDKEILPTTSGHIIARDGDPGHGNAMSDGMGGVRPREFHVAKRMAIG